MLSEEKLVQELKEGSETAFKHVVDSYQNMVYNTCLSIVRSEEDAEDIAQDVFVQVYQSIGAFKGESKLSTWIYRIATTKSLDFERKKSEKNGSGLSAAFLETIAKLSSTRRIFNTPAWYTIKRKMHPFCFRQSINFLKIKKLHFY